MNAKTKLTSKSGPLRRAVSMLLFGAAAAAALWAIMPPRALSQSHAQDQSAAISKIAPWVLQHTADGKQAEFLVVLSDQADLSGAEALATKQEKGRYVHDELWNKSQTTQGPILQWLRERRLENQSFYIVNAILVKGTREVAEALASRPDVARVEGNPHIQNLLPQPGPAVEAPSQPQAPETIEPGITYTHAPQVWALGFTGQNVVVASADTGQRWTHNALKPHYRGWDGTVADHDYNWHDSIHDSVGNPCGNDSPFPCDDFFHGTHTTGTAIGDDGAGNQIGMAPGAKWIGCRNMDRGNGTPTRYLECMQFFLAPYPVGGNPNQGDPTLAPDVTINSWTCPPSEGCSVNTLEMGVQAQRAAGIIMVVAAGNAGPACSTVSTPPGTSGFVYSIGALNTGTDTIASFSSRGPVTADGSNRLKPDLSAPGTGTRSATNSCDSCYTTASGTSMATPHVAGGMALLLSSNTSLIHDWATSEGLLNNNAAHILNGTCDGGTPVVPNNTYGYGRIDIFAAVQQALLLPELTTAVSRKMHGAAGTFDINLPQFGQPGVECRSTGGNYTQVFTFNTNVVSGSAAVTGGTGTVSGSPIFSANTMTVNLTGVVDVQKITVTLTNVTDPNGHVLPQTSVSMNVLIGDVNGNKTVNATDVALVKSQVGQAVTGSNFREDVNDDGSISASDVALTKSHVGDGVP
jgi:subtilisin family serine protease